MRHTTRDGWAWLLAGFVAACGTPEGGDDAGDDMPEAMDAEAGVDAQVDASACDEHSCQLGEVCDPHSGCRPPKACAALACSVHQLCQEGGTGDATCGACEGGYAWNPDQRRCVAIPSCDASAPGSLVQTCARSNQRCDASGGEAKCNGCIDAAELKDGKCVVNSCDALASSCLAPQVCTMDSSGAHCSGCADGYRWDDDAARCVKTCKVVTCNAGQVCVEGQGDDDAACLTRMDCDQGEVVSGSGVCVPCGQCFDQTADGGVPKAGVVGVGYEGRTEGTICVCKLKDGYFQALTGEVLACDGDGDHWTNRRSTILAGTAMQDEAHCSVSSIDRVVLRSDDVQAAAPEGVTRDLTLSLDDLRIRYPDIGLHVGETLQMIEDEAIDEQEWFDSRYEMDGQYALRSYGSGQVRFKPSQANPLTKICNHVKDDFNMDGEPDVDQLQQLGGDGHPFFHLAYFLELADGKFEDSDEDGVGTFVITERPRAGTSADKLPLPLGSQSGPDEPYAVTCLRGRDATYAGTGTPTQDALPGFDFAQFQCPLETGPCLLAAPGHSRIAYDGRPPRYVEALEQLASLAAPGAHPWDSPIDKSYLRDRESVARHESPQSVQMRATERPTASVVQQADLDLLRLRTRGSAGRWRPERPVPSALRTAQRGKRAQPLGGRRLLRLRTRRLRTRVHRRGRRVGLHEPGELSRCVQTLERPIREPTLCYT
ncbi:MAG: hypothetical protein QM778_28465 [Myxococcales bacterium]